MKRTWLDSIDMDQAGARAGSPCRLLALFGPHAMSELSLQCAPKWTSAIYGFTPQLRDENTSPLIQ
jgi:hypothetical protein